MIVSAKNVCKRYGSTKVLHNVNLNVEKGRIVGLIGPNGAGKTTLLKVMLGLESCDGNLQILGLDPFTQRDELMKNISFIADVAILPKWIKVRELLEFTQKTQENFSLDKAKELLAKTKIGLNQKVRQLSKGMVAQLHLAIVMSIDAKLLVLDEPTLGLDILFRKSFYDNLLNDYFDKERTIIITTHQIEEIEHILTDVIFIQNGKIVLDSPVDDLSSDYFEVMVDADNYQQAQQLSPLIERKVFGKYLMLFKGSKENLQHLGEVQRPSLSDLFVALMGDN